MHEPHPIDPRTGLFDADRGIPVYSRITYNEQGCCNRVKISNQINYSGEYEMIYDENRTWKIDRLRSKNSDSDWLNFSQSAVS